MLQTPGWLAFAAVAGWAGAGLGQPSRGFTAHLSGCSEFVGWGPIGLQAASALVPVGYTIAGAANGTAAIVVRVTHCASLQVRGTPAIQTSLSQIGVNVVSPDGTGDINNFTLVYASNNPYLVAAFVLSGVPARYDPEIAYDFTPAQSGVGEFYASVAPVGLPAWFFHGTEAPPPPDSAELFTANWWSGSNASIKQATIFPQISFGTANVTFYAGRGSQLGGLIGGNTDSDFSILSVRGVYDKADLTVTRSGP